MRRKLSKKQIGAMGLAVMMGAQTPAMATEISQEAATQEQQIVEPQTEVPLAEEVETTEVQMEEISTEKVETEENQTEEAQSETQTIEVQAETQAEEIQTQELEIAESQQTEDQEIEEFVRETLNEEEESVEEVSDVTETIEEDDKFDELAVDVNQEALVDGWQWDDTYVKNGELVRNQVILIDGKYYGFDQNGKRYSRQEFTMWNEETQKYDYYRAKWDGTLYVNEWYGNSAYGARSYYGKTGQAYLGLQIIDGVQYCFNDSGETYQKCSVAIDGKNYYCDIEGKATELIDNAWTKVEDDYFYVEKGVLLKDCVVKIENYYYGFDYEGRLIMSSEFCKENSETGEKAWYLAKADGSLYVNTWKSSWDYSGKAISRYYDEQGRNFEGMRVIDGEQYYFDPDSFDRELVKSKIVNVDGVLYYCDSEGKMHKIEDNQWYETDTGYWYYMRNGSILRNYTFKIDGKLYKFDETGKLVTEGRNINADGSVKANQWECDGEYWYYYGQDGEAYEKGIYSIKGKDYYFSWGGRLATSRVFYYKGDDYIADENGCITKIPQNGWIFVNGTYYYAKDGALVRNTVCQIGDFYYGFDSEGRMYVDTDFSFWQEERQYHAQKDGRVDVPEAGEMPRWYCDAKKDWYYYNEKGEYLTGEKEIYGKIYYFNGFGKLYSDGVYVGRLINEKGEVVRTPGWNRVGIKWYYINDEGYPYNGILEENGHKYFMDYEMVTDEIRCYGDTWYTMDSNGYATPIQDGIYQIQVGYYYGLYYLFANNELVTGWQNISGRWYYFEEESLQDMRVGKAITDKTYTVDGKTYYFNSEGIMESGGWILLESGCWYYAYPSGELAIGDVKINGTMYHFETDGLLRTGVHVEDGVLKWYSEDGVLLETGTSDGWYCFDGNYYYFLNGSLLKKESNWYGVFYGYHLPDGKWYIFDSDGIMQVNKEINGIWYGETGAAQTGWFQKGEKWYYANMVTAEMYKGIHWINGKKYYFDDTGAMLIGKAVVNGQMIETDNSGAVKDSTILEDGWSYHNGEWYYSKNGAPYTGWVGSYYVDLGRMVRDSIITLPEFDGLEERYYYLDENGICRKNEWVNNGESYATEDGSLANSGFFNIDGKTYWFDYRKYIKNTKPTSQGEVFTEDGEYLFSKNYGHGWLLINGKWYYKNGTNFVYNKEMKINGSSYLFNGHGTIVIGFAHVAYENFFTDEAARGEYTGRYYDADGRRCYYTGWKLIDGKWSYFNSSSEALTGWAIIGGSKYYFGENDDGNNADQTYIMTVGYRTIKGKLYYFDSNGACQGVCGPQTGWYLADGNWYYMRGGRVVTGKTVVDHVEYEFDNDGIMIS